jgi:hypothetical protein
MNGKVRLVIELEPKSGEIGLQGPLENRLLCVGMLELAKSMVLQQQPKAPEEKPRVLPVSVIPDLVKSRG